jgi:hypothetical protein
VLAWRLLAQWEPVAVALAAMRPRETVRVALQRSSPPGQAQVQSQPVLM